MIRFDRDNTGGGRYRGPGVYVIFLNQSQRNELGHFAVKFTVPEDAVEKHGTDDALWYYLNVIDHYNCCDYNSCYPFALIERGLLDGVESA